MKRILLLFGFLCLSQLQRSEAIGTEIVHDPTNYARQAEILNHTMQQVSKATEQVQKLTEQIQQMKQQYDQAKQHYESITGYKNFGEVHHNSDIKKSLPQELKSLYQASQRSVSVLRGLIDTLTEEEKYTGSVADMQAHIEGRMEQANIIDKAVGLQAYEGAQARMERVEALMNEIKNTRDPKSIAELQARIAVEQAYIQNDMTKLQLVSQLQRSEQNLIEQQKYRMSRRILNSQNTGMPSIRGR